MDNLGLLKARLNALGGTADVRIEKEKLRSLQGALKYSYQSEWIVLNGEDYQALINNNKLKVDYDDKIISIPYASQIKVGDVFFWKRTNSDWIVYLQHLSEDAYFRGYIRKAQHSIKWKDEFGNVCEAKAAVRGPVETKVRSQMKKGISYDEPNYTLSLIVPQNEDTEKLRRYTKIMVANKPWEVVATDPISEPGIIELQMVEDYFNREEDTTELVGGKLETKVVVASCLDELVESQIGEPIDLWTDVTVDGKISSELIENSKYEIVEGFANIINNQLTLTNDTKVIIAHIIPKISYRKLHQIQGVGQLTSDIVDIDIVGNNTVKSYGSSTYSIVKYLNGARVTPEGEWNIVSNPDLFKIEKRTAEELVLTWNAGKSGEVKIEYIELDKVIEKIIKVESLL